MYTLQYFHLCLAHSRALLGRMHAPENRGRGRGRFPLFVLKCQNLTHIFSHLTRIFTTGEPLTKSSSLQRFRARADIFFLALMPSSPCHARCHVATVCHVAMWPCPVAWWAPGAKHGRVQECSGQEATPKPPQSRLRGAAGPYKLLKRLATAAGGVMTWLG